ncbi:hypothetical protein INT43_000628 [Umbelopsis isabellina]|uniref:Large ribosomal subunit protein uL15/eL18 domain-containing protein n=1 Tax=Mortierella isabellina TaxID=91625 RepID=A0A8H7UIU3_MORIS|nr:hypothetical protein INT43_000628 [Umbelopsis isabellina]
MLAQFAKLSLQRSVSRPNSAAIQSVRLLSTDGKVSPPSDPVHLGNLADNPGAVTERLRLGRGPGYGKGKTAGRGHKGQNARSGNGPPRPWFEGGQTPLVKRMPKRGFFNQYAKKYQPLNLERLQHWVKDGRLNPEKVTLTELVQSRCVHKLEDGVKLLSDGAEDFHVPVNIVVSRASRKAIEAIEKAGGSVTCTYYNNLALKVMKDPVEWMSKRRVPKFAQPVKTKDIDWYSDPKNRGYLADPEAIMTEKAALKEI